YIFLINVPVGVLSLVLGRFTLPADVVRSEGASMDVLGAILLIPGMLLTFLSVTMIGPGAPWWVYASLVAGAI
ncbi:hypothetical protein RFZ03_22615, partial [Acinetobacter baumannii]|nr:hypothetical protein [Acinetobacter baumannii]